MKMTSQNISKTTDNKFEDLVIYTSICSCMDKDHNATLILELEDYNIQDFKELILEIHMDLNPADYWLNENIFSRTYRKVKYAIKILFGYPINFQGFHIFNGEEHVQDFIKALNEGLEKLKK